MDQVFGTVSNGQTPSYNGINTVHLNKQSGLDKTASSDQGLHYLPVHLHLLDM